MEQYSRDKSGLGMEGRLLEPADWELVERARGGRAEAFHALIDRHGPALMGLAVMLLGNREDAKDALQETFLGAYRGLSGFEGRASVKTWLTKILVRQVARQRRKTTPGIRGTSSSGLAEATTADPATQTDTRLDLMQMLEGLSDEHRQVIVLRELEGMSYDEMAELLGVPRGTVESRLHRAREQLRQKMKGYLD